MALALLLGTVTACGANSAPGAACAQAQVLQQQIAQQNAQLQQGLPADAQDDVARQMTRTNAELDKARKLCTK